MASKYKDSDGEIGTVGGAVAVTLPAATEIELLGNPGLPSATVGNQQGIDVSYMDRLEFGFINTGGANAATLKVYYQYIKNGRWFQDLGAGNSPSVAFGASQRLAFVNITARAVRVTATAAAGGTTGLLEGRAMGYQ